MKKQVREFESTFSYANSDDWKKTEDLKERIAKHRTQHPNEGLSMDILESIVEWKLRSQRGRTEGHVQI